MPETTFGKPDTGDRMRGTIVLYLAPTLGRPLIGKREAGLGYLDQGVVIVLGTPDIGNREAGLGYLDQGAESTLGTPDIGNREAGLRYLDQRADITLGFLNIELRYAYMGFAYRLIGLT